MRGQRAISGRRLRGAWVLGAGAIALLSAVFGGDVEAANWSSHSTTAAHANSTTSSATPTTVTTSGSVTVGNLSLTGDVSASALATTTSSTRANAAGATKTTTTTTYSSLTGIVVTGSYSIGGAPPAPFAYAFASMSAAAQAASAQGYTLTATPSAATNTITITVTPIGSTIPIATLPFAFPSPSSTTTTPAPPPLMPLVSSHGPHQPLRGAEGAPAAVSGDVAAQAQAAADEAQIDIARCSNQTPPCVANALDAYAAKLEKLAPQLPPKMRVLPGIIRQAARKVRAAKTTAEAMRAVSAAIVQVRHTVELLRAEDPDARAVGQAVGGQAVGVLQAASNKLERATEL